MTAINLLPWRAGRLRQIRRNFYTASGVCALIVLGLLSAIFLHTEQRQSQQSQRNQLLVAQLQKTGKIIGQITATIKQTRHKLAQINAITTVQNSASRTANILADLATAASPGITVRHLQRRGSIWQLSGKSQSTVALYNYMQALDASRYLRQARLEIIQGAGNDFTLLIEQVKSSP